MPPVSGNLTIFFEELTKVLSKAILKYKNIILMCDFNIDFKNKGAGFDKLSDMHDTFNLTNLIKSETLYTKNHKSLIDLFFTNKPLPFQKTDITETGLSDYHKLSSIFFKLRFSKARPKIIKYRA